LEKKRYDKGGRTVLADRTEKQKKKHTEQISQLYKQRLLGYAESFQELAKSFDTPFPKPGGDRQSILEERRLWESRQVISDNFSEISQIISRVAGEEFRYQPMEEKVRRGLIRAMREEDIFLEDLYYIPRNEDQFAISISMYTSRRGGCRAVEVADMLSVLLEKQLQVSSMSPYLVDQRKRTFVFLEQPEYVVLTGMAKAVREDETISGDNYSILESEQGRLTILLSDGTGSGERACRDSGQALDLMEKLLEVGYDLSTAVKMLNATIFSKGEDSNHPTLDVCSIDLYRGICEWIKVGGTLSFIRGEEEVEEIPSGGLPLGIFPGIDVQSNSRKLKNGDYLILMSDGVRDAFEEQPPEQSLIREVERITEQNPGEIAERILQRAICNREGHIPDDMTVIVAGIWENSGIT